MTYRAMIIIPRTVMMILKMIPLATMKLEIEKLEKEKRTMMRTKKERKEKKVRNKKEKDQKDQKTKNNLFVIISYLYYNNKQQ